MRSSTVITIIMKMVTATVIIMMGIHFDDHSKTTMVIRGHGTSRGAHKLEEYWKKRKKHVAIIIVIIMTTTYDMGDSDWLGGSMAQCSMR